MADQTVDLWATDEVHFQQHGSRCQMEDVIAGVEAEFDQWTNRNDTLRRLCAITQDVVF